MTKEELLRELTEQLERGEIRREEVFNQLSSPSAKISNKKSFLSMAKLLYALGAIVVVAGLVILVAQTWSDLGAIGRITLTLGLGLLLALIGSILFKQRPSSRLGPIFHLLGGLFIPGGAMVALSESGVEATSLWPVTLVFGIIFVFYLLLTIAHKNLILTFFSLVNGTTFIYLLTEAIISGPFYEHNDLYAYLTMAVGLSYLLLAYAWQIGWNRKLVDLLYFFGSAGFLGAAFSQVMDSPLWQIIFLLLVFGGLVLSTYLKSRIVLAVSTLFLLAHVSYITSEYFADSVGWPLALVILGFVFIGLGYLSLTINKKFIKRELV